MKLRFILVLVLFILLPSLADAQCAMCRAVLESEGSESAAKGINDGIVYLMIFPYVLIGGIGFFIYRTLKKRAKAK